MNGRTQSDPLGEFTFLSQLGRSLVDLAICTILVLPFIKDGGMLSIASGSDHLPIFIELSVDRQEIELNVICPKEQFIWNNQLKAHYNFYLQDILHGNQTTTPIIISEAITNVTRSLKMVSIRKLPRVISKNPWFNRNCKFFEYCRQSALIEMQRSNHSPEEKRNYMFLKNMCSIVTAQAKGEYYTNISTMLNSIQSPAELWKFFRSLTPRPADHSAALDINEVERHFSSLFQQFPPAHPELFINPPVPQLDNDFSLDELDYVLNKAKLNKAAGSDRLSYEFYKNLNLQNRLLLLDSLNYVLRHELIPDSWGELKMSLLYKKGDPKCPGNYRGISLLNCHAKIFTSLLTIRISKWADEYAIIPECQSGFRYLRSCIDNLFILQTIILEHTQIHGNWLFVAFIDFKQAFDRINHQALWQKLSHMGMSNKIIRILIALYKIAKVKISVGNCTTNPISILNGVLQGDCLSPLLFALFIYDLESFLSRKGIEGIGMGHLWRIICLFFADDLVLFGRNRIEMQRTLDFLVEYCAKNHLMINTKKSEVMVYSRREKLHISPLRLADGFLEITRSYCYLGVTFDANGRFASHINNVRRKSSIATVYINRIIAQCGRAINCTQSCLFKAKFLSCILYGSEAWGLSYLDELEGIQQSFYKRVFNLHPSTPKYLIRHLFDIRSQRILVIAKCINWFNKLIRMPNNRWPKKCLLRMLSRQDANNNWIGKLKQVMSEAGSEFATNEKGMIPPSLIVSLMAAEASEDLRRCRESSHCQIYAGLCTPFSTFERRFTITELRLVLQLVLHNSLKVVSFKGASIQLRSEHCRACDGTSETLEHLLFSCGAFEFDRRICGVPLGSPSLSGLLADDPAAMIRLVKFVKRIWTRAVDSFCNH